MVVVYAYLEDYDFYDCAYVFMYFFNLSMFYIFKIIFS